MIKKPVRFVVCILSMKLGLPRFGHPAVANPLRDGATKVVC
jgi:hypothetical protein